MIAEECRLRVSFRALPSRRPRAVFDAIAAAIAEVEPLDGSSPHRARVEIGEPDLVPGMLSQRGSPLEVALSRITGKAPGAARSSRPTAVASTRSGSPR